MSALFDEVTLSPKTFDYIVVGAGSAGCALAARLAEDESISVCLIEAGGTGRNLFIQMPAGNGFVFGNKNLDWGYESIPQPALNNRRIYYPRGKGLGGSSNMNGMIYMRGVPSDYERWKHNGLQQWGYHDLLPYFIRSQNSQNRSDCYHGTNGPLRTEPSVNYGVLEKAFVAAAKASGHRYLDDFNKTERSGVGRTESTVYRGIRQSSAIAYLGTVKDNLTILTQTHIHHILFDNTKAVGIRTTNGNTIYSSQEVILCQGAFGTPQTLLLSGIGPSQHLKQHNIPIIMDSPGVGSNLEDHVDVSMQYDSDRMDLSLARHQRLDKAILLMARWLLFKNGPGAGAFFSTVLFHAINDPKSPEFEVFMTPMTIEENLQDGEEETTPLLQRLGRKLLVRGRKVAKPGVQIDINLERPKSTGTVRLANTDPLQPPIIDPNYLSHKQDLDHLVIGVKAMREVMQQPQIAQYLTGELGPWKSARSDAEIIDAIRTTAYTGHHPCSSARMGGEQDCNAVLDAQLRVRGVECLRVCDASAMPSSITGNPNATIIAMAEESGGYDTRLCTTTSTTAQ